MRSAYAKNPVRELIEGRERAERDELSRIQDARLEGKLEVARGLIEAGVDLATVQSDRTLTVG